jgi:ubiquinone/menaquinone biosynthesis C-methylase UbiE
MSIQKDPEWIEVSHLKQVVDLAGKNVLEVGCGDGRLTWRYSGSTRTVTGFDPDPGAIQTARVNMPPVLKEKVRLLNATALALPHPKETFDLAFLTWSL